jgi:glycosyltransferase involved in cell wall biosynthesis
VRIAVDAAACCNRRGFGRFARELLQALVARRDGIEYVLLVDREPNAGELPGELPVELMALPRVNANPARTVTASAIAGGRRTLRELFAFTRAARRARADLLFEPASWASFPLWPGTKSVICFHDTIAESLPGLVFPDRTSAWAWRAKSWLAARQATRVMTVSNASRDALAARYGIAAERIDVVGAGASAKFRPLTDRAALADALARLGIATARPWFLFVGGLAPHKNVARLLDAYATALGDIDAGLVLVGDPAADGFRAEGVALAQRIERDERLKAGVRLLGCVGDDDLVALLNGAHALVLPSLLEGFGLPALEAMQCGTPVLASRAGALPEVVGAGGAYFTPTDAGELARALVACVRDREWRARTATLARAQAAQFSWSRAAGLAVESFRRAAGPARGREPG